MAGDELHWGDEIHWPTSISHTFNERGKLFLEHNDTHHMYKGT